MKALALTLTLIAASHVNVAQAAPTQLEQNLFTYGTYLYVSNKCSYSNTQAKKYINKLDTANKRWIYLGFNQAKKTNIGCSNLAKQNNAKIEKRLGIQNVILNY